MISKSLALLAGLLLAGQSAVALAQSWPDRPLHVVVPFPPGGLTDTVGRVSADWLSRRLGQSVVVENRSGATGAIAMDYVARSKPDGYTLLVASAAPMAMLPALMRVGFDSEKDFAPISIVATSPQALAVQPSLGVSTVQEFVALLKRQPGALNFSSGGNGTGNHLAMALFLERTGTQMQHIAFRGGAPAIQELLAGRVAAHFGNLSDIIPYAQSGQLRVLGVASEHRSPELPDVPTFVELGYPGFRAETWNGVAAPAGTPPEIVARIAHELEAGCADENFRRTLQRLGGEPVCSTPEQFTATLRADIPLWQEAVRVSGARID